MDDEKFIIPIDAIEKDFNDFLNLQNNSRIIFSGPFGIGKSYFLNKFFGPRIDQYYPVFLRPVNYSLLSNEDVFKLIKYDILYQLIQDKDFGFDEVFDFTKLDYAKTFFSENQFLILFNLMKNLPKIKQVVPVAEMIEKLFRKFRDGWKEINDNPELNILRDFQSDTETNFLLEFDDVSQLIADQLDQLIEKKKKDNILQKVLIIDDLDRLDPEHIFRLFNVFSAHFDQVNYRIADDGEKLPENKFGFDKIIFVCDIENIRKIFAHKYGEGVDFSGYIDKFYSNQIFHFNKNEIVTKFIDELFKQYENSDPQRGGSYNSILSFIKPIMIDLISANAVNHRILENINISKTRFRSPYSIISLGADPVRNFQFVIVQVIDFLYDLFGKNYTVLKRSIEKAVLLRKNLMNSRVTSHIKFFLPLLTLKEVTENSIFVWNPGNGLPSISYKIEVDEYDRLIAIPTSDVSGLKQLNYYELLLKVIENMKAVRILDQNS